MVKPRKPARDPGSQEEKSGPPPFIEVVDDRHGCTHYVNAHDIVSVSPRSGGQYTVLNVRGCPDYPFFVVDTPEELMGKVREALRPAGST